MKAVDFFNLNIQRAEELLDIHKRTYRRGRPDASGAGPDLLRAAVVFAVAALDAYMHKRVIEVVRRIIHFKKRVPEKCISPITRSLREGDIPRELIKIAITPDPEKRIIARLEKAISGSTFQKPTQLTTAFDMMEIKRPWEKLGKRVRSRRKGRRLNLRRSLEEVAKRRDDIVHEGDVYISNRSQGKIKSIRRTSVQDAISALKHFIGAVEDVTKIS